MTEMLKPDAGEDCPCGRPLLHHPGDLEATCAECRMKPGSCECTHLPPAGQVTHLHAVEDAMALSVIAAQYTPVKWAEAWSRKPADICWLYGEFLEAGTVNALFARAGTGKSLLTLEIAVAVVGDGGTVVYIDDENRVDDLVERLQAFGREPAELDRLILYSFAGLPPLDSPHGGHHLLALVLEHAATLVVLDTTTRMVAGRENDSDTFLQLYRCSLVPLKARGVTVLRLDHPGKDETRGQRGSSAKDGDVNTVWQLTEITQGAEYQLDRTKSRSGHGPDAFTLKRLYDPLRHEWEASDLSGNLSGAAKIAGQLNALNVPISAGRDTVRKILAAKGIKVANDLLSDAIKYRRACPGQVADRSDSRGDGELSAASPPIGGQADRTAIPPSRPGRDVGGTGTDHPGPNGIN